jgi:hypothetical protein
VECRGRIDEEVRKENRMGAFRELGNTGSFFMPGGERVSAFGHQYLSGL